MAGGYIGTAPATRDPTVTDDSVTTAKIQNNAVTGAKIAMTSDAVFLSLGKVISSPDCVSPCNGSSAACTEHGHQGKCQA